MLYKRSRKSGSHWWVRFTIKGREIRVTSGTTSKTLAEEFERRLREQLWREIELGEVQHTWEEATERWLKEKAHKRSIARDRQAFAAVDLQLCGQALSDIDAQRLQSVRQALVEHRRTGGAQRRPGTVNRIIAVVLAVLNECVKWGWLSSAPKLERLYDEKSPPRWITPEQFDSLCRSLKPHIEPMARFAVATGARAGNILGLRWESVDMESREFHVAASEFKGKRTISFPLNAEALRILEQQRGKHPEYVFTDQRGRAPVGSIKTAWRTATKAAGISGFRFHDLRHTWAAWHKKAGTPVMALKTLGGWSDVRMVDRYGHINATEFAQYADNRRTNNGTQDVKESEKHREK